MALGPNRATKVLCEWKQAQRDETQPSDAIEGVDFRSRSDMPFVNVVPTIGSPSEEPIAAIDTASIDLDTRTMPRPTTPATMDFKS
jgi:hypothetical protein